MSGRPDRIVPIVEGFDLLGVIQGYRDLAKEAACGANADTPTRSTSASLAGSNEEPSPSSTTSDRAGSVVAPSMSPPLASRLEALRKEWSEGPSNPIIDRILDAIENAGLRDGYRDGYVIGMDAEVQDLLSRAATLGAEEARGLLKRAAQSMADRGLRTPLLKDINEYMGRSTPELSDCHGGRQDGRALLANTGGAPPHSADSREPAPAGATPAPVVLARLGLNSEEGERRREYGSETLPRVADPKRSIGNDTGLVGEESSMQSAGSATAPSHLSSEHADLSLTEEERTNLICAYLNGYYGTVERAVAAIMFPRGRRIADLEADLRECAEAMKPFAKEAEGWPSTLKDSVRMPSRSMGAADPEGETEFTLGDLRRLAALAERIGKGNA